MVWQCTSVSFYPQPTPVCMHLHFSICGGMYGGPRSSLNIRYVCVCERERDVYVCVHVCIYMYVPCLCACVRLQGGEV